MSSYQFFSDFMIYNNENNKYQVKNITLSNPNNVTKTTVENYISELFTENNVSPLIYGYFLCRFESDSKMAYFPICYSLKQMYPSNSDEAIILSPKVTVITFFNGDYSNKCYTRINNTNNLLHLLADTGGGDTRLTSSYLVFHDSFEVRSPLEIVSGKRLMISKLICLYPFSMFCSVQNITSESLRRFNGVCLTPGSKVTFYTEENFSGTTIEFSNTSTTLKFCENIDLFRSYRIFNNNVEQILPFDDPNLYGYMFDNSKYYPLFVGTLLPTDKSINGFYVKPNVTIKLVNANDFTSYESFKKNESSYNQFISPRSNISESYYDPYVNWYMHLLYNDVSVTPSDVLLYIFDDITVHPIKFSSVNLLNLANIDTGFYLGPKTSVNLYDDINYNKINVDKLISNNTNGFLFFQSSRLHEYYDSKKIKSMKVYLNGTEVTSFVMTTTDLYNLIDFDSNIQPRIMCSRNGAIFVSFQSNKFYLSTDYGSTFTGKSYYIYQNGIGFSADSVTDFKISNNGEHAYFIVNKEKFVSSHNSLTSLQMTESLGSLTFQYIENISVNETGQYILACYRNNDSFHIGLSTNYGNSFINPIINNVGSMDNYLMFSDMNNSGSIMVITCKRTNNTFGIILSTDYGNTFNYYISNYSTLFRVPPYVNVSPSGNFIHFHSTTNGNTDVYSIIVKPSDIIAKNNVFKCTPHNWKNIFGRLYDRICDQVIAINDFGVCCVPKFTNETNVQNFFYFKYSDLNFNDLTTVVDTTKLKLIYSSYALNMQAINLFDTNDRKRILIRYCYSSNNGLYYTLHWNKYNIKYVNILQLT